MDYTPLDLDDLQPSDLAGAAALNQQLDISILEDLQNEFDYESFLQGPSPGMDNSGGRAGGGDFMMNENRESPQGSNSSQTMDFEPVMQQRDSASHQIMPHPAIGARTIAPAPAAAAQSNRASKAVAPPKQRMERRGHTKSRRGCFNCKRRRIKCQEARPACGHCVKTGLRCEYPSAPTVVHQPSNQVPLFSLQDMRFFQHFLTACVPHQPLQNESIWTHEVACLSHSYEYLMHAILGYSASDLIATDKSLVAPAMMHRVKAIKAVKKSLRDMTTKFAPPNPALDNSQGGGESPSDSGGGRDSSSSPRGRRPGVSASPSPPPSASNSHTPITEQGNALMATCFALSFQSVNLDDGMLEFMTFIRGIVIVAIQVYLRGGQFFFTNLEQESKMEWLGPLMDQVPMVPPRMVDPAAASLERLKPLIPKDGVEEQFHEFLTRMAEKLKVKNSEAYQALSSQYSWWMVLPHSEFQPLLNLSNPVLLLLYTHWIALKNVYAPITDVEHRAQRDHSPINQIRNKIKRGEETAMNRWLCWLNGKMPDAWRPYNEWPEWVENMMQTKPEIFVEEVLRDEGVEI